MATQLRVVFVRPPTTRRPGHGKVHVVGDADRCLTRCGWPYAPELDLVGPHAEVDCRRCRDPSANLVWRRRVAYPR